MILNLLYLVTDKKRAHMICFSSTPCFVLRHNQKDGSCPGTDEYINQYQKLYCAY